MAEEEKPMTVKERMAALARASGQSSAAPAPAPRASGAATGPSVAERLAKMRAGPADATTGEAPRLVRTLTPHPGAPTVVTSLPGGAGDSSKSGGASSVADRIASLSGKSSILPPSPSGRPAGASSSPTVGKTPEQGEGEVSAPAEAPAASKLSPGLAARMNAMRSSTDSVPEGEEGEEGEEEEETPPAPPSLATSGSSSSSKVSPGLAARMGKAFPIPMPGGGMPAGGVAELKRRKQEKEQAERAAAGLPEEPKEPKPSETAVEQKPGELQHANLSRPTISQRRRPRKPTRPFKPTAAATAAVPAAAAAAAPVSPPCATEPQKATSSVPEKAASPPPATTGASPAENTAEETAAPAAAAAAAVAAAAVTPAQEEANSVGKMNSMLRAASIDVAGGDGDDDEWDD